MTETKSQKIAMATAESSEGFYVSVISGSRSGLLAGPFNTKSQAEALVDVTRSAAKQINDSAHFYAYGTARAVAKAGRSLPVGRLNAMLGLPTVLAMS